MALGTGCKIAIGVVVALLLASGATCGGFYLWLRNNGDRLRAEGMATMKAGAEFGQGKDASACVAEAVRRLATVDGIVAEAGNKVFLESCLKTARLDSAVCEGVPPRDEIIRSATWAIVRCEALGKGGDKPCTRLVGAIQERCLKPAP